MKVFIDDAGDAGFKFDHGSSSHFVIACVVFDDNLIAEEVALEMKKFRRKQGWRDDHEFKFNKLKKDITEEILRLVAPFDYRVRAVRVDKSLIRSGELRQNRQTFYNFMVAQTLDRVPGLEDADIRLDGTASREYKQSTKAYFRKQLNTATKKIGDFRFVDSKTNNLIQLADLCAGSILRASSEKTDADVYVEILKERIEEIWDFR